MVTLFFCGASFVRVIFSPVSLSINSMLWVFPVLVQPLPSESAFDSVFENLPGCPKWPVFSLLQSASYLAESYYLPCLPEALLDKHLLLSLIHISEPTRL